MSFESRIIRSEETSESYGSVAGYEHREGHQLAVTFSASSLVVAIRQLQTEFEAQYQHDRRELTELNQRFRLLLERVQLLESQSSTYMLQIAELRQASNFGSIDTQWSERYLYLQSDLTTLSETKVDFEFDFELNQLQIGIYQQLLDLEQQWKGDSRSKLEQELKQSSANLANLRASYAELEREIAGLYASREDSLKQYMRVTQEWGNLKKQKKKWSLSLLTLKNQVQCYKNLRSYSAQNFQTSAEIIDVKQFYTFELEKCVKKIRHDFELLYATIYREMTAHYQTKMEEIEVEVKRAVHYQELEYKEITQSYQALQLEYEEVQQSYSYEHQIQIELEAALSKLEGEFKSIQVRQEEQFVAQSKEIQISQDKIMVMAYDVDEIRRSTKTLEIEIIVYRHLLDCTEIVEQVVVTPQPVGSEMTERFLVQSETKRHGSIGIKECAPSGKYITLMNHSTKDIDISRWLVKRRLDSATDVLYTLPDGVLLQQGRELIIYSKLGAGAAGTSTYHRVISTATHQELVCSDLASWGMGNSIQTILYNQNGAEESTHSQKIVFGGN